MELSFLYNPTLTSVHDYWKNHSFDYMDHLHYYLFLKTEQFGEIFLGKYLL